MSSESGDKKKGMLPRPMLLLGMCIGIGAGLAIGIALDNIGAGVAIGVGMGIAIGAALERRNKSGGDQ